jgi:hypothetical protein
MDLIRQSIMDIIERSKPRSLGSIFRANKMLKSAIEEYSKSFNCRSFSESLYNYYHETTPKLCKCGNVAIFKNFVLGYGTYCNHDCTHKYADQAISQRKFWENNSEKLEEMLRKRDKTNIALYGDKCAAKNPAIGKKISDALRTK